EEPATWNPETVLIVDEDSPCYTACDRRLHSPLVYEMRSQYFRMGAPFGIHLLSDLVAGNVPPAKVYFFANCYRLDAVQREAVLRTTRGKTAVWFYGGGFLGETADDANLLQMTGMTVKRSAPKPGKVAPENPAQGLASGLETPFGTETVLDPLWTVEEPESEVIARYSSGAVAVAAKQTPDGLRVYIGVLHCPAKLLRNILNASGVHVYTETDDVVLTDGHFFSVTATAEGTKSLLFAQPETVTDILDNSVLAEKTVQLPLDMVRGETRLFMLR
ncbi:MAG TPA: hypothetical protein PLC40_01975, partial [Candidatus Hydrogenedentes bacterium]|nr:hypothetical protein [Candidatus Hydrogenedentota bacterium]